MNIHRHLIPATFAAAIHVALFSLAPESVPTPLTKVTAVPLDCGPTIPDDPIVEEPEKKELGETSVTPLASGPTLPQLDEPVVTAVRPEFPIPVQERPKGTVNHLLTIPGISGPGGPPSVGEIGGPGIFRPGELDRTPNAKVQLPPDYPAAMRNSGTSGSVVVEFDVNAEGRVTRAEALRYTDREFVEPALRAVKKWRFEPGRRGGKAVSFRMTVPIEFGIENS